MDYAINRRMLLKTSAASLAIYCGTGLISKAWAAETSSSANVDIDTIIKGMSRRQKIEQMLMPDFRQWNDASGTAQDFQVMNDDVRNILDRYHFGGVILFRNNMKTTEQSLKLTTDMQTAAMTNTAQDPYGDIPLLLGIDQEGGIVYRLTSGCNMPGNMALGSTDSTEDATLYGNVVGSELSALKINVNFAPSFDVNSNPNNPVIGLRSISSDPDLVSKIGVPLMQGMQELNVATCAKHFPGHGDAGTDSHTGLPRIDKSLEELEQCEFIPFKAAFENGCDMVMTAHIQFPQIETQTATSTGDGSQINLPATLSKTFMTDILRNKLGFEGVASTDALNMGAIAENFDYIDAVKRTFVAGVDIALMPVTLLSTSDLGKLDALIQALEDDTTDLPDERLDTSVRRILTLKQKRGILGFKADTTQFDQWLAQAQQTVGGTKNRADEREIAADAVCVVRNENNTLPFRLADGDHVLLVGAYSNETPGMEFALRRLVSEGKIPAGVTWESDNYAEAYGDAESAVRALSTKLSNATHLIVISEISKVANLTTDTPSNLTGYVPAQLTKQAVAQNIPSAVMSISQPYDVAIYDMAPAVCAVFGYVGMDPTEGLQPDTAFGPNVPAGIEVICGGHAAQGSMPVDVPNVTVVDGKPAYDLNAIKYPLGHGLYYQALADEAQVDTSSLKALVAEVEATIVPQKAKYTTATYAAFEVALNAAREVLAQAKPTQQQVDDAEAKLRTARNGLTLNTQQPQGNEESQKDPGQKPSKTPTGELPQTGDFAGFATAAAAVAGAALAGAGIHHQAHNAHHNAQTSTQTDETPTE